MKVRYIRKIKVENSPYFVIATRGRAIKLRLDEIDYFEKDLRQIHVHSIKGIFSYYGSFKSLMEQVDDRFCRCHNSYLVNLHKVTRIERYRVYLDSGETVSISQRLYPSTRLRYLNE